MRGCFKAAMAFGLVAILSARRWPRAVAVAFGGGRGPVGLLGNPGVQKELKLDDAQIEKATALATETREKMMASVRSSKGSRARSG